MARSKRQKNREIAKADTTVRFGPKHTALAGLLSEARTNYEKDLTSADAAAKSAVHFAEKSKPRVAGIFDTARSQAATAQQDVQTAFGNVGAGADPFRAATARETALGTQRLAAAGASAQKELSDRQVEAVAGGQYARTAARDTYRTKLSDLQRQLQDLGDQEGAFAVSRMGALDEKAAQRGATRSNLRLASSLRTQENLRKEGVQAQRDRAKGLRESKSGLKGKKPASTTELRDFRTNFGNALSYAGRYKRENTPRHDAANTLLQGIAGTGGKTPTKGIPKAKDQLALSVALDMAYDGHVSRRNADLMKQMGVRVADIPGATSYTDYFKRQAKKGRQGTAGGRTVASQYGWGSS